VAGLT